MKIGIFLPYNIFLHGGVKEHVKYQAKILRARSHDVTIITPRPRKMPDKKIPKGVVFLGLSARIKTPSATSSDVSATSDVKAVGDELAKGYDIIHVHEPLVPMSGRQLLIQAESRALRIGTFHAALPGNTLGKRLVAAYKQYAKMVLAHIDVVTAVSPAAIGFIDDHIEDKSTINYIPNGISSKEYKHKKVKRDRNMVLFIGRLEKRKGARQAIKAFVELKRLNPKAKLKIAGDGPHRKSLETYVDTHGIKNVEFLGYIDQKKKVELLNKCRVYTSPALYGESFGIVLVEAMSTQAPIICHTNDGYRWVMKETGRLSLVDCTDAVAYAERMHLLMEDDGLRAAWQKWAKEYVKQFDYEKVVDQYEALYKKHLKLKPKSSRRKP